MFPNADFLASCDLSGLVTYFDESTDSVEYSPCSFLQDKAISEKRNPESKISKVYRFIVSFNASIWGVYMHGYT
ncbi:hypothetical protein NBRC116591_32190 [Sessilibacter corallicola]|uniref:Uncharacterized protein n=1 Tax=Sessilibacter corallicola TaxID=2904075 RepID=A0ABQ0ACM7_9GAMM